MLGFNDLIKELNLGENIVNKLNKNNVFLVKDLWKLKKKDLKDLSFSDHEIKEICVKLELRGIDLNKKIYN